MILDAKGRRLITKEIVVAIKLGMQITSQLDLPGSMKTNLKSYDEHFVDHPVYSAVLFS